MVEGGKVAPVPGPLNSASWLTLTAGFAKTLKLGCGAASDGAGRHAHIPRASRDLHVGGACKLPAAPSSCRPAKK